MSGRGTDFDIERVYDAVDWAVTFLAHLPGQKERDLQDLLMELIAVRTDLMNALGMLEEEAEAKT